MVFKYSDPYRDGDVYVQTDLKSYAAATIRKDEVAGALRSLCRSTECAHVSDDWKDKYPSDDAPHDTVGMLFVYNHDAEYNGARFYSLLGEVDQLKLHQGRKVFVVGPDDVIYLNTMSVSLRLLLGQNSGASLQAYYPDLVDRRSRTVYSPSATIEMLLAPWQVFRLTGPSPRTLVYYREEGETVEEFEFLLSYLCRHRTLLDHPTEVRMPNCNAGAAARFEKARASLISSMYSFSEVEDKLKKIEVKGTSQVVRRFSPEEIGMGIRDYT